ncbi:cytochrome oxidase assembly protein Sco [soil metagenome]
MTPLRIVRWIAWLAVFAVGLAIVWVVVGDKRPGIPAIATATIGGPFSLTDQTGATVTEAALQGHPSALFFGYTFCPDVCPTTLSDMTVWLSQLGPAADKLKVYFVTVDPERDTREQMASYLQAFDPRIVGLTGPRPAIDQMLKGFRIYSRKVGSGDTYTMDHTASVYLLDPEGHFSGTVDYQEKPEVALAKLKRLAGAT